MSILNCLARTAGSTVPYSNYEVCLIYHITISLVHTVSGIFFHVNGNQSAQIVELFLSLRYLRKIHGKKRNCSEGEKDGMLNLYLGQIL